MPPLIASTALLLGACACFALSAQEIPAPQASGPKAHPPRVVRPGVATPGVSFPMDSLKKAAVFPVQGSPDWSTTTRDSVWVSSARANHVVQLLPASNTVGIIATVQKPCSGLAEGFGSVWVPSCGPQHDVERMDPATGKIVASIPAEAANSEGGITVGADSVWFVVKPSKLIRIDPRSNTVVAMLDLPSGSENPTFGDGFIWVSSFEHDQLLKVDPKTNTIVASIPIGPKPRFLTVGAGSVWTLNQGDGSISRVDMKSSKLVATIPCGIPGAGGEISFGEGSVWATMFDFPLTQLDPASNKVVKQWGGKGGDGLHVGLGSVWLSNGQQETVWRIPPQQ